MPATSSGRGPTRRTSTALDTTAVLITVTVERQEGQAGLDRREAAGALEEVGEEEERGEQRDVGQPERQVRARARAVAQDADREERVRHARLDRGERRQQHRARAEHDERHGIAPGVRLGVREAVDEPEQAGRRRGGAEQVEPPPVPVDVPGEQPRGGHRRRDGEQQVHVQAPAPGEPLGERAAEQQPDGGPAAGDGAEDAERLPALGRLGERRGEERERGGREQRAEDALRGAGGDEHAERAGGASYGRGGGEAEQPGDERPLAAEEVAEAPAEQQERAEGERVGRDDPLAQVVGEAEVALGRGQRDVHDGHVEHDHELGDAEHGEDEPGPRRAEVVGGGHAGMTSRDAHV